MTTENITTAITLITSVIGDVITMIAANPLLLAYAVVPLVGVAIGLFGRLAK